MYATTAPATAIRNYVLAAAVVVVASVGLTDAFANPARLGQQARIDGYTQYAGAGLVAAAQTLPR